MASVSDSIEKPGSIPAADEKLSDSHSDNAVLLSRAGGSKRGWNFWLIFAVMCTVSFTAALDTTIITTALPQISESIGGQQDQYVWIANSFIFSATVCQPLYGQISNIFGRRGPYITAVTLFLLGAGVCGGSSSVGMLIGGRSVQGIGSAGMFVVSDLIVCDLVPLRHRAQYMGVILSTAAFGTVLGPIVGGALATTSWRWCFWINLPIGVPCLVLMWLFLRLRHTGGPVWQSLARVDYIGSLIFIPSILVLLLGLVLGGAVYPWSSWRTILPLVLGTIGWIAFHVHQMFCREPSVPPHLFQNRTSLTAFCLTFLAGMLFNWVSYFMPFYFQSLRNATPVLSGVYLLPFFVFLIPSAAVAGALVSKYGQYKFLHVVGFASAAVGMGLASSLDAGSNDAAWVFAQIFLSIGLGTVMTTALPAALAGLREADAATATATFSFLRSYGLVWGITLPSIIFDNQFDAYDSIISKAEVRASLSHGAAYGVSGDLQGLQGHLRDEVLQTYAVAIKYVWYTGLAFSLLGFLATFAEKRIELRKELHTEFGISEKKQKDEEEMKAGGSLESNVNATSNGLNYRRT